MAGGRCCCQPLWIANIPMHRTNGAGSGSSRRRAAGIIIKPANRVLIQKQVSCKENIEMSLTCPYCKAKNSLVSILRNGSFSWPEMAAFYSKCDKCNKKFHVKIDDGGMSIIRITSAPGPEWETLEEIKVPGLTVRADPSYLHCWYSGSHYEFVARH